VSARKPAARARRYLGDRHGGAALEFAMLGPVFLMFMIGFFQVAWAMYCASSVRYALHNSARALVINPSMSASDFQTMVKSAVSPLAAENVTVTLTKTTPSSGLQLSTATATYSYQIVIPFMPTYNGTFSTSFLQSGTSY
jgi:Flp pilus assembly protein TadG